MYKVGQAAKEQGEAGRRERARGMEEREKIGDTGDKGREINFQLCRKWLQ